MTITVFIIIDTRCCRILQSNETKSSTKKMIRGFNLEIRNTFCQLKNNEVLFFVVVRLTFQERIVWYLKRRYLVYVKTCVD